jgi:hypothetical protein
MNFERIRWGVLIGEKYLSAGEALDLLQWLSEQQEALTLVNQQMVQSPPEPVVQQRQPTEWSLADEEEMRSEDEQIACFEL